MKRVFLLFLTALLLFLCACEGAVQDPTGEGVEIEPDMLGPLFRIKAVEGQTEPQTKYYATESGIAYISKTKNGYMGGYFMLPNLISNEEIFTCTSTPSAIFDLGDEKAAVFADDQVFLLSLEEGRANSFELFGKMRHKDILLGADGAFYYDNGEYLLTAEMDFNDNYTSLEVVEKVVMPLDKIEGYTSLLGVSADGERLYYTYEEDGVRGYAYFGIGYRAERLGAVEISYRKFTRVSGTSMVLFESEAEAGETAYRLIDFDAGTEQTIRVAAAQKYEGATINYKGTHLVGYLPDTDGVGGYLDLLEFAGGKRIKHYELAELKINPSLAATGSAKYLIVGQYDDGSAYDDDGGETVTSIEVAY